MFTFFLFNKTIEERKPVTTKSVGITDIFTATSTLTKNYTDVSKNDSFQYI